MTGEEATAKGYRRTSNRYKMVSRIDRADWLNVLAEHLNRSPAEFYAPRAENPQGCWCDYYRRVLSKDTVEMLSEIEFRKVPSSDHDQTGYVQ